MRPIDLPPADLETVRRILRDHAPGLEARAFGSRVSWTARETSDLDLVLMAESPLDAGRMAALRAAFAGSDLPFRVDVADWAAVSEDFRGIINENSVTILKNNYGAVNARWTNTTLGVFCPLSYGKGLKADNRNQTGHIPVFGSNGRVGWHDKSLSKGPTVIIGRKGTVGAVHYSPIPCCPIDTTFFITEEDEDLIRFKYFMLNSLNLTEMNGDSAVPGLNRDAFHQLKISLPPIAEQRAIANILGALDDKIELNRRTNETLETMARAIFNDWFVDFGPTRAKLEGRKPYLAPEVWRLFPDRLVDTELGRIPCGWNSTAFGDVANMTSGRSYKSSELAKSEAALVTLKSFSRDGGYRPDGLKPYIGKFKNDQIIRQGEVVVACTDITQAADVVGRPAVVHSSSIYKTLIASLDMVIARPDREIGRAFLYFLCKSHAFTQHCLAYTTGTTVLHLDKKAVPIFKFACPPSSLLGKFGEIAEDTIDRVIANSVESESLAMLRDLLLPQLMSGRLRLRDAEKAAA